MAKIDTRNYGKRHPRFRYQEGGEVAAPGIDPKVHARGLGAAADLI
jgi:hypothetical protein